MKALCTYKTNKIVYQLKIDIISKRKIKSKRDKFERKFKTNRIRRHGW